MPQNLWNILAICLCAAVAHVLPWATLLGAYAILGPAHYLTEISWLHDRRYFVSRPHAWIAVALVVLVVMLLRPRTPEADGALFALLGGLTAAGLGLSWIGAGLVAVVCALVGAAGAALGWGFVLAVAILLPTLVHVFAFTIMFMAGGAVRSRRPADWLPLAVLALAAASFLFLPSTDLGAGKFTRETTQAFYGLFAQLSAPPPAVALRLVGFLGFVYAYHYLNWFLKTGLLGWHRVPPARWVALVSVWLVVMFAYTQDILLGLLISLPLSLGHVLLELPLNLQALRRLLGAAFQRGRLPAP